MLTLLYGLWRFALLHALVGPVAAGYRTDNPAEPPAIWCLVSILIIFLVMVPGVRQLFAARSIAPA